MAIYAQVVLRAYEELFETRPDGLVYRGKVYGWDSIKKVDFHDPSVVLTALLLLLTLGMVGGVPRAYLYLSDGTSIYVGESVAELDESGQVLRSGAGVFRELVRLLEAKAPTGAFRRRF